MLAYDGIKFLDLHLFGHVLLVFCSGVEMPCSSAGYQLNFVSHYLISIKPYRHACVYLQAQRQYHVCRLFEDLV